ncbi:hypothetical protein Raf01_77350 [Rugosimonospora africana]|uniref:Uncharacterized protein n=1 Tax=Rugosimonospora africana TaxID=556532 RepID=A0A8J3QZ49_9ACTN|nr:hypothetical protein Raf01_77350 [Rugosimonospora africana]
MLGFLGSDPVKAPWRCGLSRRTAALFPLIRQDDTAAQRNKRVTADGTHWSGGTPCTDPERGRQRGRGYNNRGTATKRRRKWGNP